MTPPALDRSRTVPPRLWLAVLLSAVVVGIVGMHGLAAGPGEPDHAGHHVAQVADVLSGTAVADGPVDGDEPAPVGEAGVLALCAMVLVPAAAVGLWLLAGRQVRVRRLPRLLSVAAPGAPAPSLPPPFRRQLTVLRI